ncbi:methenyltetrahydromethanopterin cyclohydrolase [Schlesneria paludicola]|uniref:methenyltetrahydromethanopterin cyclohydrolase n=1 Tax=Schlesneria paludicola TaxID=360056 RepID=UPI00029A03EA|nr:methenyltetrahydromethanopterin cyclohydrolase [Schlesneria paludicola]
MNLQLNDLASQLIEDINESPEDYRIGRHDVENNGLLLDFGVATEGGIEAGVALAAICMAGLADVSVAPGMLGDLGWPHIAVETDAPVAACLFSQYAGWKINVGKFFAMGSGPMRAVAAKEPLFDKLWYREEADQVVGVLESSKLPDAEVFEYIAEATDVEPEDVVLCVAPTSSMAGNLQVVARSVETAMHKLHELGFDVNRVRSAYGTAPLPPVANNDLEGIGRTNDAILYGARVTLWVMGDDESIAEVVQRIPSMASASYGKPFLEIFEAAGRDFYKIDPQLFSPAQVILQNVDTGRVHIAGKVNEAILRKSFGIE